ncbi:MAG TPA: GDP-mannose 4,6-dehydratase [Planctomycetota bacterium]|nr:GDP-mannose 4,6-dehydratase [Planctomycetota bacterium]
MNRFWRDRNVLVTGATGLLGAWLVEELLERAAHTVALVRDEVPNSRFYTEPMRHRVDVVHGRLEDYDCLERTLNEYEIETVLHLGAQTIVGTANRSPRATFESNIRGTWNLLEACRSIPTVKRIVVASSDKAYGDQDRLPYEEDAPLIGRHPYDVSKSCADLIALAYHHSYQLPVVVTRCGNLYGGGDLNWNRIVPGTIRSVLRNERPIIRSDGSFIRDYFYVKDAVRAYLHLAERMDDQALHGQAFNFSNELQVTVLELTRRILKVMDRADLVPVVLNEVKNEIKHQYLSAKKARERLGWESRWSLEDGLAETVAWYQQHLGRS